MRWKGTLMSLNVNWYDVEKYYLKWLRVLWFVWENLGSSPMYALCVLFLIY